MKNMKKCFIFIVSLITASVMLFAETNSFGVCDSSDIRKTIRETWFEASLTTLRNNSTEIRYNKAGEEFQIRMEETEDHFYIFVSPHKEIDVDVYSDSGKYTKKQDVYPGDTAGSWVLTRSKKDGSPIRIRYYFVANSEVYIQFSPYNRTSVCDLVIFGNYAVRNVPTGVPFERFYSASLSEVQRITKINVPWKYVTYNPEYYDSIHKMAFAIREKLPNIVYNRNAMVDEKNQIVDFVTGEKLEVMNIEKEKLPLSSSGFLKWVADGLVEPIAGSKLKRYPLLAQTVDYKEIGYQGILSNNYSLSYSLDFARNLSSAVLSVNTGMVYKFNESGVDVKIEPFATGRKDDGTINNVTFIEDCGYNLSVLKSMLYVLASEEPGNFYFGAIRETDHSHSPEVKVFNQNVIFMPYFGPDGFFNCYVFMNGMELSLSDFEKHFKNDFVYLTRVRSNSVFYPQ